MPPCLGRRTEAKFGKSPRQAPRMGWGTHAEVDPVGEIPLGRSRRAHGRRGAGPAGGHPGRGHSLGGRSRRAEPAAQCRPRHAPRASLPLPLTAARPLFRRILFAAALAGLIGGVFATATQTVRVIPIILEAETYETTAPAGHDLAGAVVEPEAWAPGAGVERTAFTLVTNVLSGVGFALLLAAGFALSGGADWRRGLYLGAAGFVAFTL